ncbi:CbtA family protein [Kitasatospora sp. NPDC090091]|uniref:CbtA family protein n=1 Tax=Kitasatospora sp. NPDC090091 TaxID=3364081 RepID=UPI003813BDFA
MVNISVGSLLGRGMLAGLLAGLPTLAVAYLLGEGPIDSAIAYEDGHMAGHGMEEELVSRTLQSTAGLATGIVVTSIALGGIAALVFAFALGRIGRFGPRATALLLSGAAFTAVGLVPFLKYPANPPASSDPETLNSRTALFFLMIALSVLLAVAAVILGRRLAPALGNWNATVAAGVAFVLAVGVAYALLPSVSETPEDFPATVLWEFRVAALAIQATLWVSFGLVFGYLAERLIHPVTRAVRATEGSASTV